jgi:hypothetical protein
MVNNAGRSVAERITAASPGMRYQELGHDYYDQQRHVARQVSHHVGKLTSLGYEVTLTRPQPDGTGEDNQAWRAAAQR